MAGHRQRHSSSLIFTGLILPLFLVLVPSARGLNCYQCQSTNSTRPFLCNEFFTEESEDEMEPQSCDTVWDAKYCIKRVGRFEGGALDCYQCTSANNWMCERHDLVKEYMQPQSCDHVFEALYCVKTVGRYGGGIGTSRFCSSVDLGNYCEEVKQPGDKLSYRTCVYTCRYDGCNPASALSSSRFFILCLSVVVFGLFFTR